MKTKSKKKKKFSIRGINNNTKFLTQRLYKKKYEKDGNETQEMKKKKK